MTRRLFRCAWIFPFALVGCDGDSDAVPQLEGRVVAYVSLDREFSEPILEEYENITGIQVAAKYDVESTKTVGLTNLILAEASRPVADIYWNNEILNTLRLKKAGLLEPFDPIEAAKIPESFKDKEKTWYGFAARARVLIINTEQLSESDRPSKLLELLDPRFKGQIGMAKPLFGTTATHAACLFQVWGPEKAKQFFRGLKEYDVQILSGNKQVAIDVASGRLKMGLTDTDDAMVMLAEGAPVAMIYLDRKPDELGTLFIPNTIAIIKGGRNPGAAKNLASSLLTPEIEERLAEGPSAQIPLLEGSTTAARVETPTTVEPMKVDFEAAAAIWDEAASFLRTEFGD
jgi:iron(III) transport system substrate-binding protein